MYIIIEGKGGAVEGVDWTGYLVGILNSEGSLTRVRVSPSIISFMCLCIDLNSLCSECSFTSIVVSIWSVGHRFLDKRGNVTFLVKETRSWSLVHWDFPCVGKLL